MKEHEIHQAAMCAEHAYTNFMLREMKCGLDITAEQFGAAAAMAYTAARAELLANQAVKS